MKAIRVREFGMPEVMKLEEVPDLLPGAGQVVVRVRAAGINPLDTLLRINTCIEYRNAFGRSNKSTRTNWKR